MKRTPLKERKLPNYTRGEELFNMVTHIVGSTMGIAVTVLCVVVAAMNGKVWNVVSGAIYGGMVIVLYAISSIYHGLTTTTSKKVFQVIDHCTIFLLIAGTYTPILLGNFRESAPVEAWIIFGIVWGFAVLGIVLNAIDLKKFKLFSMISYLGMGWCVIFRITKVTEVYGFGFILFLILGGVAYTIGAVLYNVGKVKNVKYMHSVFHIFTDVATLLHFLGIVIYVMPN